MRHQKLDGLPADWANRKYTHSGNFLAATLELIDKTIILVELEVRKLIHDPTDIFLRTAQPTLWLLIFGQVFNRLRAIPTGGLPYLDFMTAGILAQSVLFMAIFTGGMAIIWERDLGVVHKFLASPTPRVALVLGKALSCGVRSIPQAIIIYGLASLLGVQLNFHPLYLLEVILIVVLGAMCFSNLSIIIACLVKSRERFTGIGQLITMPLFFASNAIYPISLMPKWLQLISFLNPLTYQVDALRGAMLLNGTSAYGYALDFGVLLFAAVVLTVIAGRLYPQVVV
ncbi:ABC transporter permease [Scytonema sp. NUACC26]|uniref:ABC transporter permease n=1 Tax=Scytonema sp. NUACC26 TaxID=3140176 RepID=UPI0034DBB445